MSSIPNSGRLHARPSRRKASRLRGIDRANSDPPRLGHALGAFSIALGALELLAGRRMARSLGVERASPLVRGFGLREMATGAAFFLEPSASRNAWLRVAGDVLDAGVLAGAFRTRPIKRGALWGGLALIGAALLTDIAAGMTMRRPTAS